MVFKLLNRVRKAGGNMFKIILLLLVLILITLLSVVVFNQIKQKKASKLHPAGHSIGMVEVVSLNVKLEDYSPSISIPARVVAKEYAEVRPQVSGIITKLTFTEGEFVKKGKQLYQIDERPYILEQNKAKAQVDTLSAKVNRLKKVLSVGGVSKQEYDDTVAMLAQAQADLRNAKLNIEYTKVYAPTSGFVNITNLNVGALAISGQGEPLTTVTDLTTVYVDAVLPVQYLMNVTLSDISKVSIMLNKDEVFGKVKMSSVIVDPSTDTVKLRSEFENTENKILPGMFLETKFYLKPQKVVLVPQKAVIITPTGELFTWVITPESKVTFRNIKVIGTLRDKWIVSSGLEDGENIVLEGIAKIKDGMQVSIITPSSEAKK